MFKARARVQYATVVRALTWSTISIVGVGADWACIMRLLGVHYVAKISETISLFSRIWFQFGGAVCVRWACVTACIDRAIAA